MWHKVECELGVNIAQLEDDLFGTNDALGSNDQASPDTPTGNSHVPSARRIEDGANMDDEELEDLLQVCLDPIHFLLYLPLYYITIAYRHR
jgi:hypothetical protein